MLAKEGPSGELIPVKLAIITKSSFTFNKNKLNAEVNTFMILMVKFVILLCVVLLILVV